MVIFYAALQAVPRELIEAADIDGATEWHKFWIITMSLSKPILAVLALGAFTAAYSEFMMALVIVILVAAARRWLLVARTPALAVADPSQQLARMSGEEIRSLIDGAAYAFIRDGKGEIVAHTLGGFPPELQHGLTTEGQRQPYRREVVLEEKGVFETAVPVLEGQVGTVHVGFWTDVMEKEIRRAVLPLIGIIALLPIVGAILSFLLAHWIVRPIVGLTQLADKVTMGDLETSVSGECVRSRDEIGMLSAGSPPNTLRARSPSACVSTV